MTVQTDNATVVTLGDDGLPKVIDLAEAVNPETKTEPSELTEPPKEEKTEVEKVDKPWKEKTEAERIEYGMQKRIDKLTAKLHERDEVIKSMQLDHRPPAPEPVQPAPPQPVENKGNRPSPMAGEDPVDYIDRLTEWKLDQKSAQQRQQDQQAQQARNDGELLESWKSQVAKAHAKYDDFEEVTNNEDVKLAPFMARAMMESNVGADIAYYLGNNPPEANRIAGLSPTAQAREIGRLEARFTEQSGGRKVSSAPEPITPIGDKGTTGRVEKAKTLDDPNLSDSEWLALRRKEVSSRGRRR
jgi:hypothetical protein